MSDATPAVLISSKAYERIRPCVATSPGMVWSLHTIHRAEGHSPTGEQTAEIDIPHFGIGGWKKDVFNYSQCRLIKLDDEVEFYLSTATLAEIEGKMIDDVEIETRFGPRKVLLAVAPDSSKLWPGINGRGWRPFFHRLARKLRFWEIWDLCAGHTSIHIRLRKRKRGNKQ
jgi:hypothetical protein